MEYELAMQLKEASFPNIHFVDDPFGRPFVANLKAKSDSVACLLIPTLEELIEACRERFGIFELKSGISVSGGFDGKPIERGIFWYSILTISNGEYIEEIKTEHCATPAEAVARLWLALNKKTWNTN